MLLNIVIDFKKYVLTFHQKNWNLKNLYNRKKVQLLNL